MDLSRAVRVAAKVAARVAAHGEEVPHPQLHQFVNQPHGLLGVLEIQNC